MVLNVEYRTRNDEEGSGFLWNANTCMFRPRGVARPLPEPSAFDIPCSIFDGPGLHPKWQPPARRRGRTQRLIRFSPFAILDSL